MRFREKRIYAVLRLAELISNLKILVISNWRNINQDNEEQVKQLDIKIYLQKIRKQFSNQKAQTSNWVQFDILYIFKSSDISSQEELEKSL